MALDMRAAIAGDHASIDGTETVTVYQPGNAVGFEVIDARRTNRSVMWAGAGGAMVPGAIVTFYLWADVCPERPRLNARIVDADGVGYKVAGSSVYTTLRTRYDVGCTKET